MTYPTADSRGGRMLRFTIEEQETIRSLAGEVAEIAALDIHKETKNLWKNLNALRPDRPMVMIDQIPWHEIDVNRELSMVCENELPVFLEESLRQTIYRWRHMKADMVVEPYIDLPKVFEDTGYGVETDEDTASYDPSNPVRGHRYFDQLSSEDDIERIKTPFIRYDAEATEARESTAREILGGVLEVRMVGTQLAFAPWDRLVQWHGVEKSITDLIDRPNFVHSLMRRFTDAHLEMLDGIERENLIGVDLPTVHCSGAYTEELPSTAYDPTAPSAKDTWTSGMAQIFATVSPAMHDEFEIEYAVEWYDRFGLGYYGCCEPLHNKIEIISRLPRVRKISMSPWADIRVAAEGLAGRYVLSRKPNPAFLATTGWVPETVRSDLAETKSVAEEAGCAVEFILKDISTVKYEPERLWEWAEIAREVVGA